MPLCRVSVVRLRAISLSTMTTLGPVPISQPRVLFTQVHRILVHQKEGVTVPLNAGLQAVGSGYGPVSAPRLSVNEKDSLATLSAKDEPGLHHVWKHKNGECF